MQWLRCLFGKHELFKTDRVGYVGDYCEIAMGHNVEVWECKHCGTKKPGAIIPREF